MKSIYGSPLALLGVRDGKVTRVGAPGRGFMGPFGEGSGLVAGADATLIDSDGAIEVGDSVIDDGMAGAFEAGAMTAPSCTSSTLKDPACLRALAAPLIGGGSDAEGADVTSAEPISPGMPIELSNFGEGVGGCKTTAPLSCLS